MKSPTTIAVIIGALSVATQVGAQINLGILADSRREGPHRAETIDELLLFQRGQAKGTNLLTRPIIGFRQV